MRAGRLRWKPQHDHALAERFGCGDKFPTEPRVIFDELRRVIDDPTISIERSSPAHPVSPISGTDTEMFRALVAGYRKVHPGIAVLPQMVPGATDCAQLRIHGTPCYGVAIPMTVADRAREHGVDERISIDGVGQYLRALNEALGAFRVDAGHSDATLSREFEP